MFSRFASGADGRLLGSNSRRGFALFYRFRSCCFGPGSGGVERKFLACPSLQLAGVWPFRIRRRRTPSRFQFTRWFCFVLPVSKLLFRPRVWPGRTQVFGLPELAISWCQAVSHPAPLTLYSVHLRCAIFIYVPFPPSASCNQNSTLLKHLQDEQQSP